MRVPGPVPETQSSETAASGALKQPPEIRSMFDHIVHRYDLMNTVMTAGRHHDWRRRAARAAIGAGAERVLDLATGTGDLALELAGQGVPLVVAADFSGGMLASAAAKRAEAGAGAGAVRFVQADAMRLPFPDVSFDALTISFGLRNLPDYGAAVREMARVLRPGGRLVILEMTPLRQPLLRRGFELYFSRLVPLIGGLISGDRDAYGYLPRSVDAFPPAETLAALMRKAGLRNVRYELLALGTVALHIGIRR